MSVTDAPVGFVPADQEERAAPPPSAPWREHWAHRWRRSRFLVLALLVVVVLSGITLLLTARTSERPLAPDNAGDDGARAAAQILQRRGVDVQPATTMAEVGALAGPGSTVLVTDLTPLDDAQRTDLVATGADLVLVGATFSGVEGLPGVSDRIETSGAGSTEPVPARCDNPHARAAGEISGTVGSVVASDEGVTVCFPVDDDGAGGYATWQHEDRQMHYLADPRLLSNAGLAADGNAALTLRVLGQHETLVWFLPTRSDTSGTQDAVATVPPRVQLALVQLLVVGAALALWRGRSLGPVVTEAMPVVVRAAETTRGRGRLYRRFAAHSHAAAALRAGAARRMAHRLGLPRSAGAARLTHAVARATSRDPDELHGLLYGPAPTDDAGLLALSTALDTLESEVHRS